MLMKRAVRKVGILWLLGLGPRETGGCFSNEPLTTALIELCECL